jgi:hypothetical protein
MNDMMPPKDKNAIAASQLEVRNPVAFAWIGKTVLAPQLKILDNTRVALLERQSRWRR